MAVKRGNLNEEKLVGVLFSSSFRFGTLINQSFIFIGLFKLLLITTFLMKMKYLSF